MPVVPLSAVLCQLLNAPLTYLEHVQASYLQLVAETLVARGPVGLALEKNTILRKAKKRINTNMRAEPGPVV